MTLIYNALRFPIRSLSQFYDPSFYILRLLYMLNKLNLSIVTLIIDYIPFQKIKSTFYYYFRGAVLM